MGTDSLRRAARAAEVGYERTARWLAPGTYGARAGRCDETVGRFCLTFDTLSKPPRGPERPEVGAARERAIAALQALLRAAPGDLKAAGALVRMLVEGRRQDEAVEAAFAFAAASQAPLWGDWLSGYALHAAGRDSLAERHFRTALARVPEREREDITSIEWLLSAAERKRVKALPAAARAAYHDRFWRLADPMWLTAANEVWVEHVARHVEARLLSQVPLVLGMLRWGRDLDELTVRYGAPIARQRDYGSEGFSFIEHFDTAALAYVPQSLVGDALAALPPGEPWPLKAPSARSSHAPPAIRQAVPLSHQLTRIPDGDAMRVRLDAEVLPDGSATAEAVLVAWPWRGGNEIRRSMLVSGDSAAVRLELRVPRDSMVYSAEIFEPARRQLQLARYLLEPLATAPVQLSDILLTRPQPDSASDAAPALTSLLITGDTSLGVRVIVAGVEPGEAMDVEVSFARADQPSLLGRALGWTGRRLGLAGDASPPRVRWRTAAAEDRAVQINLRTPGRPGLYYVQLGVRAAAGAASTRRLVRVVSASGAG